MNTTKNRKPFLVLRLPRKLQFELVRRLVKTGFGGFTELAAWLDLEGHPISRSTLCRFAGEFKALALASPASNYDDLLRQIIMR